MSFTDPNTCACVAMVRWCGEGCGSSVYESPTGPQAD
jgi:hypothetical protein